jgi:hypothetical protein
MTPPPARRPIVGLHSLIVLVREDGQHSVQMQSARPGADKPDVSSCGPWESPADVARRLRDMAEDLARSVERAGEFVLALTQPVGAGAGRPD